MGDKKNEDISCFSDVNFNIQNLSLSPENSNRVQKINIFEVGDLETYRERMDEVLKPQSKAKFSNNFDTFEKTGQNTKEQITQINSMKLRIQQYELDKQRTKQQFDDHV